MPKEIKKAKPVAKSVFPKNIKPEVKKAVDSNIATAQKPKTNLLITIILVIIAIIAGYILGKISSLKNQTSPEAPMQGFTAPDFTLSDVNGKSYKLSTYRGKKPVLLVFERSTCIWCQRELPELKAFYQTNKDKIEVLSIGSADTFEQVKSYVENNNIQHPWLVDTEAKAMRLYNAQGTPGHFLIDKAGKIILTRPGYADLATLNSFLAKL